MERDEYIRAMAAQIEESKRILSLETYVLPYIVAYHRIILQTWGINHEANAQDTHKDINNEV